MCVCVFFCCLIFVTFIYLERKSPIGKLINDYLTKQADLDDHAVHLLFSANRWEFA